MIRRWSILFLALFLVPALGLAQTELTGTTSGGAHYKILVPDGWTPADGLAIWNHGFSLSPIGPVTDLGPLVEVQLQQGYAVAASSYSLTGWAVFETATDNREMVEAFEAEIGIPDQILITGASLGGIVTVQDIERGLLDNVVGAMPICGALAGTRTWDGGFDVRMLYENICGDVPGAELVEVPGVRFLPAPGFGEEALAVAANECFGILLPAEARSIEQTARLNQFLGATGLPENFVLTDLGFAVFGLADLIFDPRKLGGALPLGNADVRYGIPVIDTSIERFSPDPEARERLVEYYTPTGKVGDVKIVSLHTDKDGLVIVENESEYASLVPAENFTVGIVVEDVPSHCDFTPAEVLAAWESLRAWVAGFPQPSAQDLQQACLAIESEMFPGPCRIDPDFVIPDLDDRVRLRDVCVPDAHTLCLGENGRFRARVDWQDFGGNTGVGNTGALQTGDTGSFWFFDDANIELIVKALDGRQENGNLWIFFGSLTNVSFEMTVTDTQNTLTKVYTNPARSFASVGDTDAF